MSKGEETRRRVLTQAGGLLNQTGYLATSLSTILEAVGLQKGGLYNHFASKEDLALEAYRANAGALGAYLGPLARDAGDPAEVLNQLLAASLEVAAGRIVPGGCPVLNAGTEADDAFEPLRQAAAGSLETLQALFRLPLDRLAAAGRLAPGVDPGALAWLLVCTVEGGILTTKVRRDPGAQELALATLQGLLKAVVL